MTGGRRIAAFVVAMAAFLGTRIEAQSVTLSISALLADSTSPAPNMTVTGFAIRPEFGPYSVSLDLSLDAQFRNPFYARTAPGEVATFIIDSLLTERTV